MAFQGTTRRMNPLDLLAYRKVSSVCFEYPFAYEGDAQAFYDENKASSAESFEKSMKHLHHKYVAEYDGQIVAGLADYPYQINFDGQTQRMSGIGGVCSHPSYRRLGAVRALFRHMLADAQADGTEWSVLYPFSQTYYEKFGYALSEPAQEWSFSLRHVAPLSNDSYSFSLHEGGTEGLEDFAAAYARMTGSNMMVQRETCDFSKVIYANPYKKNDFAYLCRDADGVPRGYAIWHKETEAGALIMQMTELVFDGMPALRAILRFAATFTSHYDILRFEAPSHLNLEALCTDFATGQVHRRLRTHSMMRVVHTENALRGAALQGSGEAVLHIDDPGLTRQHNLALRWRDGQLTDIGNTGLAPDAELAVGTFSALLLGRYNASDFPYLNGAAFARPDKLTGLFYKKAIDLKNSF